MVKFLNTCKLPNMQLYDTEFEDSFTELVESINKTLSSICNLEIARDTYIVDMKDLIEDKLEGIDYTCTEMCNSMDSFILNLAKVFEREILPVFLEVVTSEDDIADTYEEISEYIYNEFYENAETDIECDIMDIIDAFLENVVEGNKELEDNIKYTEMYKRYLDILNNN